MSCTQHRQLASFPRARVQKNWFRQFNDPRDFRNGGTVHLFSLMALYSYADFRSSTRAVCHRRYRESPGQWICRIPALPRILRVTSEDQAMALMDLFREEGFLDYEMLDEESGVLRYTVSGWNRFGVHLEYNYYSYKGSGFFFFPLSAERKLLGASKKRGRAVFSELDAVMDLWIHTVSDDPAVRGSESMPVVCIPETGVRPFLSCARLAARWGWSKSRAEPGCRARTDR